MYPAIRRANHSGDWCDLRREGVRVRCVATVTRHGLATGTTDAVMALAERVEVELALSDG